MAYRASGSQGSNPLILYALCIGGVVVGLLFHFLLPPRRVPAPEPEDVIGCYAAPGWPLIAITADAVTMPGAPPQEWHPRIFKDAVGIEVAPGFAGTADKRFSAGATGFIERLDRASDGKLKPSRAQGSIRWLKLGDTAFERTPCPAETPA